MWYHHKLATLGFSAAQLGASAPGLFRFLFALDHEPGRDPD
jgi:hypothetical protein